MGTEIEIHECLARRVTETPRRARSCPDVTHEMEADVAIVNRWFGNAWSAGTVQTGGFSAGWLPFDDDRPRTLLRTRASVECIGQRLNGFTEVGNAKNPLVFRISTDMNLVGPPGSWPFSPGGDTDKVFQAIVWDDHAYTPASATLFTPELWTSWAHLAGGEVDAHSNENYPGSDAILTSWAITTLDGGGTGIVDAEFTAAVWIRQLWRFDDA